MKQRRGRRKGLAQGHALLYGRSSRAIRIVNGENVKRVEKLTHSAKKMNFPEKKVQKKYVMSEDVKKKLDKLKDPLTIIDRSTRTQKYEAANSSEKYEYGLSDW